MDELKPCPFCGGRPVYRLRAVNGTGANRGWVIECHDCVAYGPLTTARQTKDEAAAAWNNREASETSPAGSTTAHSLPPEAQKGV